MYSLSHDFLTSACFSLKSEQEPLNAQHVFCFSYSVLHAGRFCSYCRKSRIQFWIRGDKMSDITRCRANIFTAKINRDFNINQFIIGCSLKKPCISLTFAINTDNVVIAGVPDVRLIDNVSASSLSFEIHFSVSLAIDG